MNLRLSIRQKKMTKVKAHFTDIFVHIFNLLQQGNFQVYTPLLWSFFAQTKSCQDVPPNTD